jgi:light-harvesting complex 1 beta chain
MASGITEGRATRLESSSAGSQGIFVVIFIAFLLLALVSLLCGQNWRTSLPGAEGARSVFTGVKSAVYTVMSELV